MTRSVAALEESALAFPHRTRYLQLQLRLARRMLDADSEWVREVLAELAPAAGAPGRTVR